MSTHTQTYSRLLKEKRSELKHLSSNDLLVSILAYPDQDSLNYDASGARRNFPVGQVARDIEGRQHGRMTEKQFYALVHHFSAIVCQEVPIETDTTLTARQLEAVAPDGDIMVHLYPEPSDSYPPRVRAVGNQQDGSHVFPVGHLPEAFTRAHPVLEDVYVHGTLYQEQFLVSLDTEAIDRQARAAIQNGTAAFTDADLQGLGDLSLDMPEHPEGAFMSGIPEEFQYTFPLRINGQGIKEGQRQAAEDHLNLFDLKTYLNADLLAMADTADAVTSARVRFAQDGKSGSIVLTADRELSERALSVADSYLHYLLEDGYLASDAKYGGHYLVSRQEPVFQVDGQDHFTAVNESPARKQEGPFLDKGNTGNEDLRAQKARELAALPLPELLERVLSYPDQDSLDFDKDGDPKPVQAGKLAERLFRQGGTIEDYRQLAESFAESLVPEIKVAGVTFRDNDPRSFALTEVPGQSPSSTVREYQVPYLLRPEPDNPHDKNAIMVLTPKPDGELHQVGYLPRAFAEQYRLENDLAVSGRVVDYSNGNFKQMSYRMMLDLDQFQARGTETLLDQKNVYETRFSVIPEMEPYYKAIEQCLNKEFRTFCFEEGLPDNAQAVWTISPYGDGLLRFGLDGALSHEQEYQAQRELADMMAERYGTIAWDVEHFLRYKYDMGDFTEAAFYNVERPEELSVPKEHTEAASYHAERPEELSVPKEQAPENGLSLTDADLAFGEQLSLSDFGLS